jgi:hypothetical protein
MHLRWTWRMTGIGALFFGMFLGISPSSMTAIKTQDLKIQVKYVLKDVVYLNAGSESGLFAGEILIIRRDEKGTTDIAEIELESIASISAAGKILSSKSAVLPGDQAYISSQSPTAVQQAELQKAKENSPSNVSSEQNNRKHTSGTQKDINRIRGRFGVDFNALQLSGSGIDSSQFGFMLRMDASRIGGSYWNIRGYYRGRIQSHKERLGGDTLTDLINRTYHLGIYYENPSSRWIAGAGRIYVPWAASLSTIDGFYLGRRFGKQTAGVFGGTTPDPSSWNYNQDRKLAGIFVNTERGSFESLRFSSTSGIALSRLRWAPDRQFGFFENGIFYKQFLSIFSNIEMDFRTASQNSGKQQVVLSRSYVTVQIQPHKMISFDISENYFRNIPSFDTRLIATGLVDKFLYQGLTGGIRLSLPYQIGIWGNTGRSSRTGDPKASWNYLGGASMDNILQSGIRAEYRHSRFDSSFGGGTYQSFGVKREIGSTLHLDLQAGQQDFRSAFTDQNRARFFTANLDWQLRNHYFIGGSLTVYRGQLQKYNQYFLSFGYRFDTRK